MKNNLVVIWTENVDSVDQDQTAHSVQSDLYLHCPYVLSSVRKELIKIYLSGQKPSGFVFTHNS